MKNIKKDFPLLINNPSVVYLDSASTTQKPQMVLDAMMNVYREYNANPGRAIYQWAEESTAAYEKARATVASFIGADPDEIVFVRGGATEGLNAIAGGMAQKIVAGDEILLTELEHHANLVPWQRLAAQTGARLRFIPITSEGTLNYSSVGDLISQKTKIVSVTQNSNVIGLAVDLDPIITAAKSAGALVAVDACQSAPHQPIDLKKLGCDFLVFSSHKVLGPTGTGALFIKKERTKDFQPLLLGGGAVLSVDWLSHTLRKAPEKFEAGSPALMEAIGFAAALEYITKNIPFDELRSHEAALCAQLIAGLQNYSHIKIIGPLDQLKKSGHLVTFSVDGIHAHDVAAFLASRNIGVRAGHFCAQPLLTKLGYSSAVRASFYAYNDHTDVTKFLEAIDSL